ncbi:MAG: manganese efflux pump [Clostridiales bacterium]|jgi:putative Mn2+ efflux pump MntP|nr:manganese efflux pump [Clostridiales bacterium]
MGFITLLLIALGLAMDAFAVSVSNGICYIKTGLKEAFYTGFAFGLFQAIMPLLGYYAGSIFSDSVEFLGPWIALILLVIIGGSMVIGAIKEIRNPGIDRYRVSCSIKDLSIQGIATSIDALAVGVSLAVIKTNIFTAVALIGIVTFICCFIGVLIGSGIGRKLKEKAEIVGGCILILIGIKIFIENSM